VSSIHVSCSAACVTRLGTTFICSLRIVQGQCRVGVVPVNGRTRVRQRLFNCSHDNRVRTNERQVTNDRPRLSSERTVYFASDRWLDENHRQNKIAAQSKAMPVSRRTRSATDAEDTCERRTHAAMLTYQRFAWIFLVDVMFEHISTNISPVTSTDVDTRRVFVPSFRHGNVRCDR
jgi:hypothetical protein